MEIYIEYAFLQNFFFDGVLLFLALKAGRVEILKKRLFFASLVGAAFALLFPLLKTSANVLLLFKFSVGFLLCLIAVGEVKTRNEWLRFARTSVFFFAFSFGAGGTLLALFQDFSFQTQGNGEVFAQRTPIFITTILFALISVLILLFTRFLYARRLAHKYVYACNAVFEEKQVKTSGFLDSGNRAIKDGVPVCFISPELLFCLYGEDVLYKQKEKEWGQVCDEMEIKTVSGAKKLALYKGKLRIKTDSGKDMEKQVYFAVSANMLSREYKIILNSHIFDDGTGV